MIFCNDTIESIDAPAYLARLISVSSLMGLTSIMLLTCSLYVATKLILVLNPEFNLVDLGFGINLIAGLSFCGCMILPYLAPVPFIRILFPNFAAAWHRQHNTFSPNF